MNRKGSTAVSALIILICVILADDNTIAGDFNLRSIPVTQPLTLDGLVAHWPDSACSFLKDQEASIGLCNDADRLYIMLRFRNPRYARLIRMSGLTLYLDNSGKKKKDFMLKLTAGPSRDQMRKLGGNDQRPENGREEDFRGGPEDTAAPQNKLFCSQKDVIVLKEIPSDGSEGPQAAFAVDQGFFVYEFSVPLKSSSVRNYGLGADQKHEISVGMIWGEPPQRESGPEGHGGFEGGGRFPGGGRGGHGGGMPEGEGEGGRHGRGGGDWGGAGGAARPTKQEVWLKTSLAAVNAP